MNENELQMYLVEMEEMGYFVVVVVVGGFFRKINIACDEKDTDNQ